MLHAPTSRRAPSGTGGPSGRPTGSRLRRRRLLFGTAALLALLMVAAACTTPPTGSVDRYGLRAELLDDGIRLSWQDPGTSPGFELQVLEPGGTWQHLASTPDLAYTDTAVPNRATRQYRVRSAGTSGATSWSAVVKATYVELLLPVVRVDTEGAAPVVSKDDYLDAQLEIDPNGSGYDAFSGITEIKGRGNTTWNLPKKPYKLKLDSKSSLFGKPAEKDWVLLANFNDRSHLRTWTAQTLGHLTELEWTPDSVFVELVLNGEYLGVYQLTEQVEIKANRLDITEMEPEDIAGEAVTGGYLLEIDGRLEENNEPGFRTDRGRPVVIKEPEPANLQQRSYIRGYIQDFEDALYGPQSADPVNGYRAYMDVDSYIDWYIVEELVKNQDANYSSAYFYKDRNEKLRFGPLWDFDLSMGTDAGIVPQDPEQWWVNQPNKPWTNRFFEDPTFLTRLDERWDSYKQGIDQVPQQLLGLGADLEEAIANDGSRWNFVVEPNDTPQYLADWLTTRTAWMDAQIDALASP